MKYVDIIPALLLIYVRTAFCGGLLFDPRDKSIPSDVTHENKSGIDFYNMNSTDYDQAILFTSKFKTKGHIKQLIIFKVDNISYYKLSIINSKNKPTTSCFVTKDGTLISTNLETILSSLAKLKQQNNIPDDLIASISAKSSQPPAAPAPIQSPNSPTAAVPNHSNHGSDDSADHSESNFTLPQNKGTNQEGASHQTRSDVNADKKMIKDLVQTQPKANKMPVNPPCSHGPNNNNSTKGTLSTTSTLSDTPSAHASLHPPSTSDTVESMVYTRSPYTCKFGALNNIEITKQLQLVTLDSKINLCDVVVSETDDCMLYTVDGGFDPKVHILKISFGPLNIQYKDDYFVSLRSMKMDKKQVEIVSIHEQGFYTMIYDSNNYNLDLTIPRFSELPKPITGKYLIIDLINPNLSEMSNMVETENYSNFVTYKIMDNDFVIDVRCKNVDSYLDKCEKERNLFVQMDNNEIISVTITSVLEGGDTLVRSFIKDGVKYIFDKGKTCTEIH